LAKIENIQLFEFQVDVNVWAGEIIRQHEWCLWFRPNCKRRT